MALWLLDVQTFLKWKILAESSLLICFSSGGAAFFASSV
jgi:hypothetical protein